MSKESIEKINALLDEANENIKFAQNYLKTGEMDFEKAPKTIKETHGKITATIAASAIGAAVSGGIGVATAGLSMGAGALATGALGFTSTVGIALGGTLFTPFMPIAAPVLLGSIITTAVAKKHLKERKVQIVHAKDELDNCINDIAKDYNENNAKAKSNNENYYKRIIDVIKEFEQKAKETGKKAAIIIDDAKHTDVNKRIAQYQKIVLKQYEHQNELDKKLYDVAVAYQKVLEENKALIEKNNKLMAILQSLGKSQVELESLLNV